MTANPICEYCDEVILPGEEARGLQNKLHRECAFRMVAGSVGHLMKMCHCYGGEIEDPPGFTIREAARLAMNYWLEHRLEGARRG
jgi:hypothetical protein